MTAAALPRRGDRTLPRPLESAIEFLRLLSKRPSGLIGFAGIVFFLVLAFIAPIFVPNQESADVTALYQTPSAQHLLGTDNSGRDVLNQIVQGGKEIISVALITAFLTTLVATLLGSVSALVKRDRSFGARGALMSKTTMLPPLYSVATTSRVPSSEMATSPSVAADATMTESTSCGTSPLTSQMKSAFPTTPGVRTAPAHVVV